MEFFEFDESFLGDKTIDAVPDFDMHTKIFNGGTKTAEYCSGYLSKSGATYTKVSGYNKAQGQSCANEYQLKSGKGGLSNSALGKVTNTKFGGTVKK